MFKRICLLLLAAPLITSAQKTPPSQPKLVIGIVIDQMRPDYLERFSKKFGSDGFNRLLKGGYVCKNTQYNYSPTYTGPGHASIYTGTTPSVHGIAGNDWYDSKERKSVYCTSDSLVKGVGSSGSEGSMSPVRLLTTTITDQLKLNSRFRSKVIGIALKDRGAILPAGRAADAAYWYDGKTGNWISSTWYIETLPKWVEDFNARRWPDEYLSKTWNTFLPISTYTESDNDDAPYENPFKGESAPVFPHNLPSLKDSTYDLLRRVPFGNTLTKDFAISAIAAEQMGADSITDFLCISFSATDYVGHQFGPNAIETEDTYIRLDRDLSDFFNYLDTKIGKGNYLVFATADHACMENPKHMQDHQLYAGITSPLEITNALRGFLTEKFGDSRYMKTFINDQVILDAELIQKENKDLCEIQRMLADFASDKITGAYMALTACQLESGNVNDLFSERIRRGHYRGRSGHIWLVYSPGWTDRLYGTDGTRGTTHGSPFPYDTHVPLIWYGWKIPKGTHYGEISITDIAPTLAFMINITLPNGCTGKIIPPLLK